VLGLKLKYRWHDPRWFAQALLDHRSPNNRMQRSVTHKVLGRGRRRVVLGQVTSARVLERSRAVADAGRWATVS
jgi:hypothetical protein